MTNRALSREALQHHFEYILGERDDAIELADHFSDIIEDIIYGGCDDVAEADALWNRLNDLAEKIR